MATRPRTAKPADAPPPDVVTTPNWRRSTQILAVVVAVLAAALLTTALSHDPAAEQAAPTTTVAPSTPSEDGPEAGFARDMQVHHAQAVEMALIIRDNTSDPIIRAIGYDIATAQQQQIGQLFAWLELWGLPQTGSADPMAWMTAEMGAGEHDMTAGAMADMTLLPDGRMPGMASEDELDKLRRLRGEAAERLFLVLMIRHHKAGVVMAQSALSLSDQPQLTRFATNVVTAQSAEIEQMADLLAELDAPS